MARRKYRYGTRHDVVSERSLQDYAYNAPAALTTRTELLRLVRGGEDSYLELKVRLSNSEKIAQEICALANTDGGTMIFGVDDQLRIQGVDAPENVRDELSRICREDITPPIVPLIDSVAFDSGKIVVSLDIEPKRRPYRTKDGRFYLRIGAEKREATREELSNWLDEIRPLGFENLPAIGARETDIDDMLLWTFARFFTGDAFDEHFIPANYATGEFLKRDLLLAAGNMDDFTPTIAAVLLFGKNERVPILIPRSTIFVTRYSGDLPTSPIIETVEFKGNLLTLYEKSLKFIERYCDLSIERIRANVSNVNHQNGNSPVKARGKYHNGAIREALTNALIHRDLAIREVKTRISIFDSYIEISNPRRMNGFVPPAKYAIRYGVPQRLNPQTLSFFTSEAYGANIETGNLPKMLRESRLFSNKKTEIITANDEFKVRFSSR
ncbi:MAG: putative DNA binding domain-containing protein [Pyrinomonadaceae bacterium]|nr:putative DNA binding domain-containing protein [Pyrinomonadaceae bacterium]